MNSNNPQQELLALISMLDEPDNKALGFISQQIFAYGPDAIPTLEEAWENTFNNLLQERIEDMIHNIQQDTLYHEMNNWANLGNSDLAKGCYLVSRFHYPTLKQEVITTAIARLRVDIWLELNDELTALEKIKVLNHILFAVRKYKGVVNEDNNPRLTLINMLLENHKGDAISLGALYIILAQVLDMPVYGVDLPQHFILAYTRRPMDEKRPFLDASDVLFYINPFRQGAVFTIKQIEHYLKQMDIEMQPSHFLPCSNKVIIRRMMTEMLQSYSRLGKADMVSELQALMKALD
jgi:regulator of sirC expression with transglutaminase-like and TPR domain